MNNFIVPERGDNTVGLVVYLFGPGRHNEHTDQRVIAASANFGIPDSTRLDYLTQDEEIIALGRGMDSHRKAMGVTMPGGHVWHCAVSVPPEESAGEHKLTDAQWAEVAREAVKQLGFDDEGSGKAPCRWVAVNHGLSTGGNDHIHLVVNLVREDGTFASVFRDRKKMSRVCAEFERRFGLRVVEGREGGGAPGLSRAEIERAAREGQAEPDRIRLARTVRGCAAAATSEADFVQRLAAAGVLARPRYETGGRDVVVGYSVALAPGRGVRGQGAEGTKGRTRGPLIWFGGGRLGRDLTLPRLREYWQSSPAAEAEALRRWRGAGSRRTASAGPGVAYGNAAWEQASRIVMGVREGLDAVPVGDVAAWSGAAREAAGILAAWSCQVEAEAPGPLAEAADIVARSAWTRVGQPRPQRVGGVKDLRGVAMVVVSATRERDSLASQMVLLRQITRLMEAIHDMHLAVGQDRQAAALATVARTGLAGLHRARAGAAGASPGARIGPSSGVPDGRPPRPRLGHSGQGPGIGR